MIFFMCLRIIFIHLKLRMYSWMLTIDTLQVKIVIYTYI
jgi:hypothetical protein